MGSWLTDLPKGKAGTARSYFFALAGGSPIVGPGGAVRVVQLE